jgi:hypothetical protein
MNHLEKTDKNYFWIERPKAVIQELLRHFDKVEDVTYVNDDTPSIMVNDLYQVYLPNSIHQSEFCSNNYGVIRDSDMQVGATQLFQWADTLDIVIDIITSMIEEDKPILLSEMNHRMRMIKEDLDIIKKEFSEEQLLAPSSIFDRLEIHFLKIELACNMKKKECLTWTSYCKD